MWLSGGTEGYENQCKIDGKISTQGILWLCVDQGQKILVILNLFPT